MRKNSKGMGGHQSSSMVTDQWLTPPSIIKSLGEFDLDPCTPIVRPWDTAKKHYNVLDNGLILPWEGRVWLNPPYGREMELWLEKMSQHLNGISLIFARTETQAFQKYVFPAADSILFLEGRLTFLDVHGNPAPHNSGAPSILVAYGEENVEALEECGLRGRHVLINSMPMVIIGLDENHALSGQSWRAIINVALVKNNGKASVETIYQMVERIAPKRVRQNQNYRAKIRQILRKHFPRVKRGVYEINLN